MRHNKKFNHLSRKSAHRHALLANMAISLIQHKRIHTTLPKAKALRVYVEPLLTKAKHDTTANRRTVFSYLQDKEAIKELFGNVADQIASRPGGYTRIIKLGKRTSDDADLAFIELVDFDDNMAKTPEKKTRTRRSHGKKATADEQALQGSTAPDATDATQEPAPAEAPAPEPTAEAPAQ